MRRPLLSLALTTFALLASLGAAGATPAPRDGTDPVGGWPLRPTPTVVAVFDPPTSDYGAGHRGVDLAGSAGQVVRAALPGTITVAGSLAGRGVVVIDHGSTRTTYEPLAATVAIGEQVQLGSPIGVLQVATSHCFPSACLHWGWIEGASSYLDPLRLVGGGPIRLLPLWRESPLDRTAPTIGVGRGRPALRLWPPWLDLLLA